jgi:hypothetical protein
MRWARALAVLGFTVSLSCSQSATTGDEGQSPPSVEPAATTPACAPGSTDPLLAFAGRTCPWELVAASDGVRLRSLQPEPPPAIAGVLPEACTAARCSFEGIESSVGPLVLAVLPSPHSEMPAGTWLGAVIDDRLRFIDLWEGAGEGVTADSTPLGPAHALAPHDCKGELALMVVDRLEAAEGVAPREALVARQGRVIAEGEQGAKTEARALSGCRAIALPLP